MCTITPSPSTMADHAHCAYCFETLAASLEDREPLEYHQVLDRWAQWESEQTPGSSNPATEAHVEKEPGHTTESADAEGSTGSSGSHLIEGIAHPKPVNATTKTGLQLPSISRLQVPSPASASSTSSTPSSLSTTSSSAALGDKSKSSSNSSFFSFGRSKHSSPAPPKDEEHPLFVTWNTVSQRSGHKSLRGCIGTFEAHELGHGLREYALTAAFDDTRFSPISLSELRTLSCAVTLLTKFTPCADAFDWELGVHGIRISFSHHGKRYGATYLPDVSLRSLGHYPGLRASFISGGRSVRMQDGFTGESRITSPVLAFFSHSTDLRLYSRLRWSRAGTKRKL